MPDHRICLPSLYHKNYRKRLSSTKYYISEDDTSMIAGTTFAKIEQGKKALLDRLIVFTRSEVPCCD